MCVLAMKGSIANVVIACPDGEWCDDHWEGAVRDLALFYAELLEMQIVREDWLKIGKDAETYPQLAFGDGPTENYVAPRWPDPDYPQQIHLDFPVSDLDAAEGLALGLGATRLQDRGDLRSYADPVGHPFCFYLESEETALEGRPLSGRIGRIVFDCLSPRALASFYEELFGLDTRLEDSVELVVSAVSDERGPMLAFQQSVGSAPRWPDERYPQQLHLDVYFDDGAGARELAERLGAVRLPAMGGSCAVYADPAAHPFCLCAPGE